MNFKILARKKAINLPFSIIYHHSELPNLDMSKIYFLHCRVLRVLAENPAYSTAVMTDSFCPHKNIAIPAPLKPTSPSLALSNHGSVFVYTCALFPKCHVSKMTVRVPVGRTSFTQQSACGVHTYCCICQ